MRTAVDLVEEEADGAIARIHVPVGRVEAGDVPIRRRKTDEVTLRLLREALIDDREVLDALGFTDELRDLPDDLRLADAVRTTKQDRDVLREDGSDIEERMDRHGIDIRHELRLSFFGGCVLAG